MNKSNSLFLLRLCLGFLFLWAGTSKALLGFSAEQYLSQATSGPFVAIFSSLAGNVVVDFLVVFGEIGIGISLVAGVLTKFGCKMGMLMMGLFYFSAFPSKQGLFNDQLIYLLVFLHLLYSNAGLYLGLDKKLKNTAFIKKNQWTSWFL